MNIPPNHPVNLKQVQGVACRSRSFTAPKTHRFKLAGRKVLYNGAEKSLVITLENNTHLTTFGFRFNRGGTHLSRTMMLEDLSTLLGYINHPDAAKKEYIQAVKDDNCLGKRSGKTRALTSRHLADLYSLDTAEILFRALLFFWHRDPAGRPLLALLCAWARDSVLRATASLVLSLSEGTVITWEVMAAHIDALEPGRFSPATLKSTAQNINATWTRSGHLRGRARKVRTRAVPTAGSVAYALLLGYLTGVRGPGLFRTENARLLDCPNDQVMALARVASGKGWIVFKQAGDVIEVLFPALINPQEMAQLQHTGGFVE